MTHAQRTNIFTAWIRYALNSTTEHARKTNWTRFTNACNAARIQPWNAHRVDSAFMELYKQLPNFVNEDPQDK